MTKETQRAECRALSEAELNCVVGGTSGLIYAVAHEIQKAVNQNGVPNKVDGELKVMWF